MNTRDALINILADGSFYSGQKLGAMLGLSRSAVWKQVQALSQYQLDIHAVSGKGYRLAQPLELLDKDVIFSHIGTLEDKAPFDIDVLLDVDSTNRYLIEKSKLDQRNRQVCIAEYQHAGRGRRGREWVSPFASSLYCSLLWRSNLSLSALSCLGLVVAVALARALNKEGLKGHQIKWPNDLYWQDKKMGGILLEAAGEVSGPGVIVIGIGLNIDLPSTAAEKIDQPWVDLNMALNTKVSRNKVAALVIAEVFNSLSQFEQQGFDCFHQEWDSLDLLKKRPIKLSTGNGTIEGYAEGVDEQGALLLRMDDGDIKQFYSGEVSVRYDV